MAAFGYRFKPVLFLVETRINFSRRRTGLAVPNYPKCPGSTK